MALHGLSSEQPGIEYCRILIKELDDLKSRPTAGAPSGSGGVAPSGSGGDGNVGLVPGPTGVEVVKTGAGMEVELEVDPVLERSELRVDAFVAKLQVHSTLAELQSSFKEHFLSDERVVFIADCPTSKPKVLDRLLENFAKFLKSHEVSRHCILIPCGRRLDQASASVTSGVGPSPG